MRIAMFTNLFAPLVGGTERSVAAFASDLRQLGHDVLVAAGRQDGAPASETGVLRLPLTVPPGTDILGGFSPDVVHLHQPFLLGDSAFRLAADRGPPLVYTHHTLYARPDDRVALAELAALEAPARDLAIASSNHCHAVIAPTGSIASILKSQGVLGNISILPTGIDTKAFAGGDGAAFRQRHGLPSDAFVVGHLGRLVPAKRAVFLAEAMAAFLSGSPLSYALVCGEGESTEEVRSRFTEARVEDRLLLLGEFPDADLASAYAAMDLFAFASLTDTQGLVLLEAMASGIPVLALRATGPQDLLPDGKGSRLLPPETTPADFAAVIAELAASRDLALLQAKVETEWRRALRSGASPSLLHSRGFPSIEAK